MTDRFNFYDVYGYLIPGFVLLGFLWLPFGLLHGEPPSLGFADAVGGLLAAYILGHVLSSIAARALPSGRRISPQDVRLPSDDMLDKDLGLNSVKYIEQLEERIRQEFGVDLTDQAIGERDTVALRRKAFLLCRDRLVVEGKGAYAEQFEGLYTMMRGVCGASVIAAYYLLGWLAGALPTQTAVEVVGTDGIPTAATFAGLFVVALDYWLNRSWKSSGRSVQGGTAKASGARQVGNPAQPNELLRKPQLKWIWDVARWVHDRWAGIVLLFSVAVAFYSGYLPAHAPLAAGLDYGVFTALTIGALFLVARFHAGYIYFANTFAEAVFRSFLALPTKAGSTQKSSAPRQNKS